MKNCPRESSPFDIVEARKGYRRMMKIFHTDKNHVPEAKLISQAIVKAAELLSNKKFEEAYRQYGQQKLPITSESINWGELRQAWNAILKYYLEVKSR